MYIYLVVSKTPWICIIHVAGYTDPNSKYYESIINYEAIYLTFLPR